MKQAILVRIDLKLPKGKLSAMVAHASVESVLKSRKEIVENWKNEGMPKIILKVKDLEELKNYQKIASNNKIITALITDAGKTFFKEPTTTALAIGPDENSKINKVIKNLKLL